MSSRSGCIFRGGVGRQERPWVARALLALFGVAATAQCSGAPPLEVAGPPPPSVPSPALSQLLSLLPNVDDERAIFEAQQQLVVDCMRSKGFEFVPLEFESIRTQIRVGVLGATDEAFAAEWGFGLGDLGVEEESAPQLVNDVVAYNEALLGRGPGTIVVVPGGVGEIQFPSEGCYAESLAQLYGDVRQYQVATTFRINLVNQLQVVLETDERMRESFDVYEDCVNDAGYPEMSSPRVARIVTLRTGGSFSSRRASEVPRAIADVRCTIAADLNNTGSTILAELISEALDRNSELLTAFGAAETAALDRVLDGFESDTDSP